MSNLKHKTQWCYLYDFGKEVLTGLIDILVYGAGCPGRFRMQWKEDTDLEKHLDAIQRHQMDIREGLFYDDDTGKCHGLHIAGRALIVAWLIINKKGTGIEPKQIAIHTSGGTGRPGEAVHPNNDTFYVERD